MRKQDVIDHFGSVTAVAEALSISRSAVYQWPDEVPLVSALNLERITTGKLKVKRIPMPGEVEQRVVGN